MKKKISLSRMIHRYFQPVNGFLENAGFDVSSALGFAEALEVGKTPCDFDLILMGHQCHKKTKLRF